MLEKRKHFKERTQTVRTSGSSSIAGDPRFPLPRRVPELLPGHYASPRSAVIFRDSFSLPSTSLFLISNVQPAEASSTVPLYYGRRRRFESIYFLVTNEESQTAGRGSV